MPMTFTDDMVRDRLIRKEMSTAGTMTELRNRYAEYVEAEVGDYLEAWEIRTGAPWDEMTTDEARTLLDAKPHLRRNPAVLSRAGLIPNCACNLPAAE